MDGMDGAECTRQHEPSDFRLNSPHQNSAELSQGRASPDETITTPFPNQDTGTSPAEVVSTLGCIADWQLPLRCPVLGTLLCSSIPRSFAEQGFPDQSDSSPPVPIGFVQSLRLAERPDWAM